jgi:hypothetical protein
MYLITIILITLFLTIIKEDSYNPAAITNNVVVVNATLLNQVI